MTRIAIPWHDGYLAAAEAAPTWGALMVDCLTLLAPCPYSPCSLHGVEWWDGVRAYIADVTGIVPV